MRLRTDTSFVLLTGGGRWRGRKGNAGWVLTFTRPAKPETQLREETVLRAVPIGAATESYAVFSDAFLAQQHFIFKDEMLHRRLHADADLVARDAALVQFTGRAADRSEWARLAGSKMTTSTSQSRIYWLEWMEWMASTTCITHHLETIP